MPGPVDVGDSVARPWLRGDCGERLAGEGVPGLGPPSAWPPALSNAVALVLQSAFPMFLVWGPERRLVYNSAYVAILGAKHPAALGRPFAEVWPEVDGEISPIMARAFAGQGSFFEDFEVALDRGAAVQRAWFTFSYSPIYDARGDIPGVLCVCVETTANVETQARLRFLDELSARVSEISDADALMSVTTRMVGEHMGVSVCAYADMEEDEDAFTIRGDWSAPGSPSIVGRYRLADFGRLAVTNLSAGRPLVINDNRHEIAPEEAATFQSIGITATICMPLVKEGRLRALMAVHHREAHMWTESELALIREVTERCWAHVQRVGAEAELRDRAEQLHLATDAAEVGFWDVDPLSDTLYWPPRVKAMFGIGPDAAVSMSGDFFPGIHPQDRAQVEEAWAAAVDPQRRALYDVEYRTIGKEDGLLRWLAAKGRGLFDEHGRCYRVIGTVVDITERKRAERDAAEKGRFLAVLNDTGAALAGELDLQKVVQMVTDAGVDITHAEFGAFFYNLIDEAGESYMLYTLSGVDPDKFAKFPMPRNTAVFAPTFSGEGVIRSDDITADPRYGKNAPRKGMPEGHLPVRSYLAVPVVSRSGEVLGGLFFGHSATGMFTADAEALINGLAGQAAVAIDNARLYQAAKSELGRRRAIEEQQRLLINELNHRVKNTLSTIQSIVGQTSRRTADAGQLKRALEGRLMALSGAHDVLTSRSWESAELADVADRALAPFRVASDRFRVSGPPVRLTPSQALAISMALHELSTNALKYGALSVEQGQVELSWATDGTSLDIDWQERGGPPVTPPEASGFGSRLLQRGLAGDLGGQVTLAFEPSGVRCHITAPLGGGQDPRLFDTSATA